MLLNGDDSKSLLAEFTKDNCGDAVVVVGDFIASHRRHCVINIHRPQGEKEAPTYIGQGCTITFENTFHTGIGHFTNTCTQTSAKVPSTTFIPHCLLHICTYVSYIAINDEKFPLPQGNL